MLHSGNFALNDTDVLGPDSISYQEKPVVGLRLDGIPQKQGYEAMEWRYTTVPGDEMRVMQQAWIVARGQGLNVRFVNKLGIVETAFLYMQQPVIGKRRTYVYDNVVIRFTASYRTGVAPNTPLQAGASVTYGQFIQNEVFLQGIASAESFGSFLISMPIIFSSISSAEAFGTFTIAGGEPDIPVPPGPSEPTSIDSGTVFEIDYIAGTTGPRSRNMGPWVYQGNLYVMTFASDPPTGNYNINTISIYKSDDGGFTWAEQDSANHLNAQLDADEPTASAYQVGAVIYVFWIDSDYHGHITTFSLSADLWGSSMGLSPSASEIYFQQFVAVRSTGDIVPVYTEWPDFKETHFSVYNGGWTIDHTMAFALVEGPFEDFTVRNLIVDASNRIHIFAYHYSDYTGYKTLVHRVIQADNTLGSQTVVIDNGSVTPIYYHVNDAVDIANDGVMGILYVDESELVRLALSSDDGLTPIWTTHAIPGAEEPQGRTLVWDGTQWCVFYLDTSYDLHIAIWNGSTFDDSLVSLPFLDGYGLGEMYARRIADGRIGLLITGLRYLEIDT